MNVALIPYSFNFGITYFTWESVESSKRRLTAAALFPYHFAMPGTPFSDANAKDTVVAPMERRNTPISVLCFRTVMRNPGSPVLDRGKRRNRIFQGNRLTTRGPIAPATGVGSNFQHRSRISRFLPRRESYSVFPPRFG